MHETKLIFQMPKHYSLFMTCHAHGWKNLSPFNYDCKDNRLSFALLVNGQSHDISIEQTNDGLEAKISSETPIGADHQESIRRSIARALDLNFDTQGLLKKAKKAGIEYENLVLKGAGRLLKSPTLWEDAAKTLFTTNCSWVLTKKMCEATCSNNFVAPTPLGHYPFPGPDAFIGLSEDEIRRLIPLGYRANYFLSLSRAFSKDSQLQGIEEKKFPPKKAFMIAKDLKGFGDYAASHLLIMAGYFEIIPVDTVVISYLKSVHKVRKVDSFIDRKYGKWKEYKWWGLKLEKMINKRNWLGD